jgi:hypothetical protein
MTIEIGIVKKAHQLWYEANRRSNDRKQLEREEAEKMQQPEVEDVVADLSDIEKLFAEKKHGTHMLEIDFEPFGEPEEYPSARGGGEMTTCWQWKHKLTGVSIRRYMSQSKKSWDSGKLSAYLDKLRLSCDGSIACQRATKILDLNKRRKRCSSDGAVAVTVPRAGPTKESLVRQWVRSVMFCIEANCSTVALQGRFAQRFFSLLDGSHAPPQRLPFMRIVRLLQQAVFREFARIVNDNLLLYGSNFLSTNSDFYTNSERHASFGCLVSNQLAQKYIFHVRIADRRWDDSFFSKHELTFLSFLIRISEACS